MEGFIVGLGAGQIGNGGTVITTKHLWELNVSSGALTAQQVQDIIDSKKDTVSHAMSLPTGDLTAGDTDAFHAPYDFTLVTFWGALNVPPTGSAAVFDLKKNGVSITSSYAIVDANEETSLTGSAPVLTETSFLKGDKITPVLFQVGSITTGESAKIYLEIIKT